MICGLPLSIIRPFEMERLVSNNDMGKKNECRFSELTIDGYLFYIAVNGSLVVFCLKCHHYLWWPLDPTLSIWSTFKKAIFLLFSIGLFFSFASFLILCSFKSGEV